jgi:hypothetical protein
VIFLNLKYKESIINKIKWFLENFLIDLEIQFEKCGMGQMYKYIFKNKCFFCKLKLKSKITKVRK